jgi:branched-chain amino acid transport system permease protein
MQNYQKMMKNIALAIALCALPFLLGGIGGNSWVRIADNTLLSIMLVLGLNVVVGFAGLLDLGFVAFFAVGAYLTAFLSSPHLTTQFPAIAAMFPDGMHTSIFILLPLSAIVASFFGALLGAPTLKLRGDYLAIVTLGFGEIIRIFMNNLDRPLNITNGAKGITSIDGVNLFGFDFAQSHMVMGYKLDSVYFYYFLLLFLVVLTAIICKRIYDSRIGRAWMAIRENEIAAKAMGINTRDVKLSAFAFGAAFGGVSGSVFASFQQFVSPESFVLWESIVLVAMIVIGGIGHIPGVILGAVVLNVIPELLRYTIGPVQEMLFGKVLLEAEVARQLFFALSMLLVMLYKSDGLWPVPKHEDKAKKTKEA